MKNPGAVFHSWSNIPPLEMPVPKYFFDTRNAAKEIGLSVRQLARRAEDRGIKPHEFRNGGRMQYKYTRPQIDELKK